MKPWAALLAVGLLVWSAASAHAGEPRFSDSLNVTETREAGLHHLTSDQIGALDALVRLDFAKPPPRAKDGTPLETRFSQRLNEDERRAAGLTALTAPEIARLDALVENHAAKLSARALLSPPVFVSPIQRLRPIEDKPTTGQIHGSYSMSMGWGKGGYSERTVGGTVNYTSPDGTLFLEVGYWETHAKGGSPYIYRDPSAPVAPVAPPK